MSMEWISVKDRLPENLQKIAVINESGNIHSGIFHEGPDKFCLDDGILFDPVGKYCSIEEYYTHWIALPEPPKSEPEILQR